jgi:ribosomal 50S subunit-recycling heat shock protein
VNGQVAKPAKLVQSGDQIHWRQPSRVLTLRIAKIPELSPGKKEASSLYELINTEWLPRES